MNTYVIYHTDKTLDNNQNLIGDVDSLAKENPTEIKILNRFKNIKCTLIASSIKGITIIGALGYLVSLNQVIEDAKEKEDF